MLILYFLLYQYNVAESKLHMLDQNILKRKKNVKRHEHPVPQKVVAAKEPLPNKLAIPSRL